MLSEAVAKAAETIGTNPNDDDDILKRLDETYKNANPLQQAKLRLISAIGLIMNSTSHQDIKTDAMMLAISGYTADVTVDVCEIFAKGMLANMDLKLGIVVVANRSEQIAADASKKLVNILETLTYDNKPKAEG